MKRRGNLATPSERAHTSHLLEIANAVGARQAALTANTMDAMRNVAAGAAPKRERFNPQHEDPIAWTSQREPKGATVVA